MPKSGMSGYGDIKTKKFLNVITWLKNHKPVTVGKGGRHNLKIVCIHNEQSFSLPTSHPEINKHIVKAFADWLVKNEICTKEEFDEKI